MSKRIIFSIISTLLSALCMCTFMSCSSEQTTPQDKRILGIWKAELKAEDDGTESFLYLILSTNGTGEVIRTESSQRIEMPIRYYYVDNTLTTINAGGIREDWTINWIDEDSFRADDGHSLTLTFRRENIIRE